MNKRTIKNRPALGKGLAQLMPATQSAQLDRRSVTIGRMQERIEELEALLACVPQRERQKAEAKASYVAGRMSYRQMMEQM